MLREKRKTINSVSQALDLLITVFSFTGAFIIKRDFLPEHFRGLIPSPHYTLVLLLIIIIWYLSFKICSNQTSFRTIDFSEVFWNVVKSVSLGILILFTALYALNMKAISRIMLGIFYLLNIGSLLLFKGIVFKTLKHYRSKGFNYKNVLLVGSMEGAKDILQAIENNSESGFNIIGCLEKNRKDIGRDVGNGLKVIGTLGDLENILKQQVIDELIITMPVQDVPDAASFITTAERIGVTIRILPQWLIRKYEFTPQTGKFVINDFLGITTLTIMTTPIENGALLIKEILDYLIAVTLFIICLPVFIFVGLSIKLISKGPVFYKQIRCGLNGRKITVYKFRTMIADAEDRQAHLMAKNECDGPVFKIKDDPRIIPYIGRFVRKTSIDELPQLINVLKGEMSLVGPRPPIPEEVKKYDTWQRRRLSMKPGITCLWQTRPDRNDVPFNEWMNLDLKYIDNWSLGMDLKILLKTALVVVRGEGR